MYLSSRARVLCGLDIRKVLLSPERFDLTLELQEAFVPLPQAPNSLHSHYQPSTPPQSGMKQEEVCCVHHGNGLILGGA